MKNFAGNIESPVPEKRPGARPRLAEQYVAHIFAVERMVFRYIDASQLADRRQKIATCHDRRVVDAPGGHMPGPVDDERHANSAFIQAALPPAERPSRTNSAVSRVANVNVFRAVVAGE